MAEENDACPDAAKGFKALLIFRKGSLI